MRQSTYLKAVLKALEVGGWWIAGVDDGGDKTDYFANTVPLSARIKPTMEAVKAVEDATIFIENGTDDAFLRIVWQGPDESYEEGEEIICDHSTNLSAIINSVGE